MLNLLKYNIKFTAVGKKLMMLVVQSRTQMITQKLVKLKRNLLIIIMTNILFPQNLILNKI